MDYKYNCSSLYYLNMESGLIPVPEDSVRSYIVKTPEEGDLGKIYNNIYEFNGSSWTYKETITEDGDW